MPILSVSLAIAATLIASFLALLTYSHHRKQALRFWERERLLPDATRYENLQIRLEELQQTYDELKDTLFDAQQTIEAAQYQRQWMEDAKEEIARLEQDKQEVARVENELSTLQSELAELRNQQASLDGEIKQRKDVIDELELEEKSRRRGLEDLDSQLAKAEAIRQELASLENQREESKSKLAELERRGNELRTKLEDELRGLKQQRDQSQSEVNSLDEAIKDLTRERDSLEEERRDLRKQVESLESKAGALNASIPLMQADYERLASAVDQSSPTTSPEKNEIWHPVIVPGRLADAQRDEIDSLTDLKRCLRSLRLRFDDRMLYAFHTSLKTTDSSPLVTLAGVSGTGKSELPRRYAEALGMNFLNVAVQPRWDSPQDLFGFYDYLERRFRPTDLTRALIQMDPFGPEDGRGWNPPEGYDAHRCPNQLLLVLLDEMNLARVEYYFSEFLSRLETRRGIDRKKRHQRERAEIALEVGGRRSGELPMQLFVDSNVLFVGTMNEDETTQALSDKVIDRANVLRFGSPVSIEPVSAAEGNGRGNKDVPKLSRRTWESWCRSADDLAADDRSKLLEWIGQVRSTMDRINRPFAYRVAHSILDYAANYPVVENRLEYVIADQIEQKILPKLMGLNPQDPNVRLVFDSINTILDKVDDDILRSRIERCCQDDYFQWTGLDRSEV